MNHPTIQPYNHTTIQPSNHPTIQPSNYPTIQPPPHCKQHQLLGCLAVRLLGCSAAWLFGCSAFAFHGVQAVCLCAVWRGQTSQTKTHTERRGICRSSCFYRRSTASSAQCVLGRSRRFCQAPLDHCSSDFHSEHSGCDAFICQSGKSGQSGKFGQSGQSGKFGKFGQSGQSGQSGQLDNPREHASVRSQAAPDVDYFMVVREQRGEHRRPARHDGHQQPADL